MNIPRFFCLLLAAAVLSITTAQAQAEGISVSGAVLKPGQYQWHPDARLRDAAVAGQVSANAWFLGAALLRKSALEPQQRLKAGLLYELRVNRLHANLTGNAALPDLLDRLREQVAAMPVTGRVPAQLDPFQLLILKNNALLQAGDRLIYPTRPAHIRVMGAVASECVLGFDPALRLRDYLRQCPAHETADADHVLVIQPDGRIQRAGIAYWNEQEINLAVGAIIYRPLRTRLLSPDAQDLNQDMAAMLATQYMLGGRFGE